MSLIKYQSVWRRGDKAPCILNLGSGSSGHLHTPILTGEEVWWIPHPVCMLWGEKSAPTKTQTPFSQSPTTLPSKYSELLKLEKNIFTKYI